MGKLKIHTSYGKQDAVIIDPTPWQVIYVETDYDETVNAFIRNNYDAICKAFDEVGYEFCYVPRLSEDIGNDEMVSYYAPYLSKRVSRLSTPDILSYIGIEDKCIGSALKIIDNAKSIDGVVAFTTISFDGYADCLDSFFDDVVALLKHVEVDYCYEQYALTHMIDYDEDEEPEDFADSRFYSEIDQLMDDVRDKIRRLQQCGVNEVVLLQLLKPEIKLSRMVITERGRIILPDYGNREIKMTPLVKAVYFLFLRHPEGIVFKHLPDHREELLRIYLRLTGRSSDEAIKRSIEDVTNPCKNSINEKCARIREAFIGEFDDRLAEYYYVTGTRGLEKSIMLSRDMVTWECDVS